MSSGSDEHAIAFAKAIKDGKCSNCGRMVMMPDDPDGMCMMCQMKINRVEDVFGAEAAFVSDLPTPEELDEMLKDKPKEPPYWWTTTKYCKTPGCNNKVGTVRNWSEGPQQKLQDYCQSCTFKDTSNIDYFTASEDVFDQAWDGLVKMDFALGGRFKNERGERDWHGIRFGRPVDYTFRQANDGSKQTVSDQTFVNLPRLQARYGKQFSEQDMINYIISVMRHEAGHDAHALADPFYSQFMPRTFTDEERSGWRSFRGESPTEHDSMQEKVAYIVQHQGDIDSSDAWWANDSIQDIIARERADQAFMRGLTNHPDVGSRFRDREAKNPRLLARRGGPIKDMQGVNRVFRNLENAMLDTVMSSGVDSEMFQYGDLESQADRMAGARTATADARRALNRYKKELVSGARKGFPKSFADLPDSLQQKIGQLQVREALARSQRERDPMTLRLPRDETHQLLLEDPDAFLDSWEPITQDEYNSKPYEHFHHWHSENVKKPYIDLDLDGYAVPNRLKSQVSHEIKTRIGDQAAKGIHGGGRYFIFKPKKKRPLRRLPRDYNFETAMESALNFIPQTRVYRVGLGDGVKEEMEYQWGDGE